MIKQKITLDEVIDFMNQIFDRINNKQPQVPIKQEIK